MLLPKLGHLNILYLILPLSFPPQLSYIIQISSGQLTGRGKPCFWSEVSMSLYPLFQVKCTASIPVMPLSSAQNQSAAPQIAQTAIPQDTPSFYHLKALGLGTCL